MTASARRFVGEQTFAAVTGKPPATELFGAERVSPHTELAQWADLVIVAPATASIISKLANGLSDDLASATLLATTAPVFVAPAMHTEMWEHPATQRNIGTLIGDGHRLLGPVAGSLAGGDVGPGRMLEPDEILQGVEQYVAGPLAGWNVLVSAGGTREPIDPVRYVGNRSSGKMGYAVAEAAADLGARVQLVSSAQLPAPTGVEVVQVETAAEMAEAVWSLAPQTDVAVLAAAVADFKPADPAKTKLRRSSGVPKIELEPTVDILAGVAALEQRPFLIGFAAETGSVEGAKRKAVEKGVDLLVANDVAEPGSGFGTDSNRVTIIHPDGRQEEWELMEKRQVASRLWDLVRQIRQT